MKNQLATPLSVQLMTLAYKGRPSDPSALISKVDSKLRDEDIVEQFIKSAEYIVNTVTPNSSGNPSGGLNFNEATLINTYYQRLFGRLAAVQEIADWQNALRNGFCNHDYLGITIANAGMNLRDSVPAERDMKAVLLAKLSTSDSFSALIAKDPASANLYNSSSVAQKSAKDFIQTISTKVAATKSEVSAAVAAMLSGTGAVGQTFSLTSGVDVADSSFSARGTIDTTSAFTFSGANEQINSGVGTLGADDTLIDDSTADTDVLTVF
jgi:hypothetical protein